MTAALTEIRYMRSSTDPGTAMTAPDSWVRIHLCQKSGRCCATKKHAPMSFSSKKEVFSVTEGIFSSVRY